MGLSESANNNNMGQGFDYFNFNPLEPDPTGAFVDQERAYGHYDKALEARINDARKSRQEDRKFAMQLGRRALNLPNDEEVDPVNIDAHKEDRRTQYIYPPPQISPDEIAKKVLEILPKPSPGTGAVGSSNNGIGTKGVIGLVAGTAVATALTTLFPWGGAALMVLGMLAKQPPQQPLPPQTQVIEKSTIEKKQIIFYDAQGNEIHIDRLPQELKDK